jgi:hypothetical protein
MNSFEIIDIIRIIVLTIDMSTFSLLPLVNKTFHSVIHERARGLLANGRTVYRYYFNPFEIVELNYANLLRCLIDIGKVSDVDVDYLERLIAGSGSESMVRLWISKYTIAPRSLALIKSRFDISDSEFR